MFAPTSGLATVSHHLHRIRRSALNPLFSKQVISRFSPEIQSRMNTLCDKLIGYKGVSTPVSIYSVVGCFTADVIMQYSFARSYELVSTCKDFNSTFINGLNAMGNNVHVLIHFPWVLNFMKALPEFLSTKLNPEFASIFVFHKVYLEHTRKVMTDPLIRSRKFTHKLEPL